MCEKLIFLLKIRQKLHEIVQSLVYIDDDDEDNNIIIIFFF